jgi:hypothetical protein
MPKVTMVQHINVQITNRQRAQDLLIKLGLVFIVIRQHRVHLRQRQMRVLQVHLFRAGAMRQLVRGHFNDFDFGAGDPGDATLI